MCTSHTKWKAGKCNPLSPCPILLYSVVKKVWKPLIQLQCPQKTYAKLNEPNLCPSLQRKSSLREMDVWKEANQGGTHGLQASWGCTGVPLCLMTLSAHTEPPPAYCKTNIGAGEQGWRPMTKSAARSLLHLPPKVRERQGAEELCLWSPAGSLWLNDLSSPLTITETLGKLQ